MHSFLFFSSLPFGIRLITLATAVRWVGWGMVEALIPIFLFSFSESYTGTGVMLATYHVVFLLCLPFVGKMVKNKGIRYTLIISLLCYPFLSFSYFLAGVFHAGIFIIIARVINGFGYATSGVGINTYFRHHSPKERRGEILGFFTSITNLFWLFGLIASLFLVKVFEIHELFLAIIPFNILAILLLFKLPKEKEKISSDEIPEKTHIFQVFKNFLNFPLEVKMLGALLVVNIFLNFITDVFVPLKSYEDGGNLSQVIWLTIFQVLPCLIGTPLGILSDRNKGKSIFLGLLSAVVFLLLLLFVENFILKLLCIFLLSNSILFLEFTGESLVTKMVKDHEYTDLTTSLEAIKRIGDIGGILILGMSMDALGYSMTLTLAAAGTLGMFLWFWRKRKLFSL